MPKEILRKEAQKLIASGAQLLDVLELREYLESYLPGAVHIHLRKLPEQARDKLDPDRPVVVYCHDYARDMSPRAASRLESLGFSEVYD